MASAMPLCARMNRNKTTVMAVTKQVLNEEMCFPNVISSTGSRITDNEIRKPDEKMFQYSSDESAVTEAIRSIFFQSFIGWTSIFYGERPDYTVTK